MTTILMVYVSGVPQMLDVALSSMYRHDAGCDYRLKIITDVNDSKAISEIRSVCPYSGVEVAPLFVGNPKSGSGQHGRLLDKAMKSVCTEYVMTLDSDCFPVSEMWLVSLQKMLEDNQNAGVAGIKWPWVPMVDPIDVSSIEGRIRSFQCFNNTQPACQLFKTQLIQDKGWLFADADGDDTNHGLMKKLHANGMTAVGLMPTRGPFPDADCDFDPEFNRHESLVFGDLFYHHVGASRESRDSLEKTGFFKSARQRVYDEKGAEWMLLNDNAYKFRYDREEEVVAFKMRMMYLQMQTFLLENNTLFGDNWA